MKNQWVMDMVSGMVSNLVAMSLKWTPSADTLTDTEEAWVKVFLASGSAQNVETDMPRFRQAYKKLISNPDLEWPSPQMLLQLLPSRKTVYCQKALPGLSLNETLQLESLSPEQKGKNAERAIKMINEILG